MTRRRLMTAFAVVGVLVSAALALLPRVGDSHSRVHPEARKRFERGLEAELDLRYADARNEYFEALRADPTWLPPLLQLYGAMRVDLSSRGVAQLDTIATFAQSRVLRHCLTQVALFVRGYAAARIEPTGEDGAVEDCAQLLRLRILPTPDGCPTLDGAARRFEERMAQAPILGMRCTASTDSPAQWREQQQQAVARQSGRHHPLSRAAAYAHEAVAWHELGEHARAFDAEKRARRDPGWVRPGFRARYWTAAEVHGVVFDRQNRGAAVDELQHAAAIVDSALSALREIGSEGDDLAETVHLNDVALHTLNTGDLGRAEDDWRRVVSLAERLDDAALLANALMRLGRVHVKRGATESGESTLLRARLAGAEADTPRIAKEIEHNLLHLYEAMGRDADARRAGEGFVRFASAGGLDEVRMMSARDLGRFLQARGESDSARVLFARMLADIDSLRGQWNYAAEYFETRGDLDRARAYYQRSLAKEEETARVLEGLTRIALAQGDIAEAERLARRHDARRVGVGRPESASLLPTVLVETRQYLPARLALEEARAETLRRGQTAAWAQQTLELAEVELALGNPMSGRLLADSAGAAAQRAGEVGLVQRAAIARVLAEARTATPGEGPDLRRRAAAIRAAVERGADAMLRISVGRVAAEVSASTDHLEESLAEFARVADLSDSIARGIMLDPDRAGFRSAQRRVYDGALAAIIAERQRPEAPNHLRRWSQRRKARALGTDANGRAHRFVSSAFTPVQTAPDEAVLDFVLLDTLAAVLVTRADSSVLLQLEASPDEIRAAIDRLHRGMRARVGSVIDRSRARFDVTAARALSAAIIEPLLPRLVGVSRLTIVPDGALFLVPFDALPIGVSGRGPRAAPEDQLLIDRFEILQAMAPLSAEPPSSRGGQVLALAPDRGAPGTAREILELRRAVPDDRLRVLEGARASVAGFRAAAPTASVLHFATHAEANALRPEETRILLSADRGHDGDLAPAEIARFEFRGALVVLSACETAAGRTLEGEGVLSLSRSFLAAGAGATIATLWPVGERSADFARAFYPRLLAGESPAEALRGAKQALRASGAAPVDWAPYVLFVNGSRPVTLAALPR